ncbi:MAG: glutathione-disulfide reductase [Methylobacteriaceae bacterium]|nr:glutathione-disulfide reductase [Methylobacteriaceae bacterium]MBV9246113.1 glutathione-disulfide reductase [Methylobacteriaceae bacterium]
MAEYDVDLFVIGAGSGGVRAARVAGHYGASVMVAEESRIGGTCVIRGCVPKKLLVYASRFREDFEDAAGYGWTVPPASFDWPTLIAHKDKEIARLSAAYRAAVEGAGGTIVEERAVIEGPHSVRLPKSGRTVRARHILVAVGAAPVLEPDIPGRQHAMSSDDVFDLGLFPKRLLVVGGGYIAVEFASLFARLGAEVTHVARSGNILRGFDEDLRDGLRDALRQAGIQFSFKLLPTRIEKTAGGLSVTLSDERAMTFDRVLIATGRRPNTAGLGLEQAGVEMDVDGAIKVNAYSRTSVNSIHAVGDVTNRVNLTPVAIREAHAFADTVFGGKMIAVDHVNVPSAVFATPEIGTVGLSEERARESRTVVDIYKTTFRPMKATLSGRNERTMMKLVVDGTTDKVLGVHILGHDAAEIAQAVAIAVKMGATKADFDATMALHPTAGEELVTMQKRTARYERAVVGEGAIPAPVSS